MEEKRNEKVKREKEPLRGALSLSLEVPPPLLACLSQTRLSFIYKRTAKEEEGEEKGRRSEALTLITFGIIELYVRYFVLFEAGFYETVSGKENFTQAFSRLIGGRGIPPQKTELEFSK